MPKAVSSWHGQGPGAIAAAGQTAPFEQMLCEPTTGVHCRTPGRDRTQPDGPDRSSTHMSPVLPTHCLLRRVLGAEGTCTRKRKQSRPQTGEVPRPCRSRASAPHMPGMKWPSHARTQEHDGTRKQQKGRQKKSSWAHAHMLHHIAHTALGTGPIMRDSIHHLLSPSFRTPVGRVMEQNASARSAKRHDFPAHSAPLKLGQNFSSACGAAFVRPSVHLRQGVLGIEAPSSA